LIRALQQHAAADLNWLVRYYAFVDCVLQAPVPKEALIAALNEVDGREARLDSTASLVRVRSSGPPG
jgi:hypothetical protein